jgi:hypothetical protein
MTDAAAGRERARTRALNQSKGEGPKIMRRFSWLKTFRTGYAFYVGVLLCSAAPALEPFRVFDFDALTP